MLNVDLLQDHQKYCLQVCMCALFSYFTGKGSDGVNYTSRYYRYKEIPVFQIKLYRQNRPSYEHGYI